ncbi:Hypothetical predicted protein [Cloeon dipterum]|uniref:Uncharacterized protein n=1 Tax=Cloeon dipterum TaxID=197152 RepID=A0A8S1CT75_9INSE|nr:Hypothetical predicted protein [Cloeon dipterum]
MSSQGAAAGPSGSKKCYYCHQDTTDCEIIQVFIKKQSAFICQECQETEKFTVANLIEMMMLSGIKEGVDLESIRKMPFLQNYRFPEVLADISYETLGYLKLGECMQCEEKIKHHIVKTHLNRSPFHFIADQLMGRAPYYSREVNFRFDIHLRDSNNILQDGSSVSFGFLDFEQCGFCCLKAIK